MPNVGKPSKGCQHCRDGKVKCDLKRPSCSQCIRAGKECYGYRDPLSMMFKNESNVVRNKAQKKYEELSRKRAVKKTTSKRLLVRAKMSDGSSSDAMTTPQSLETASTIPRTASPPRPMTSSIENQAISFFAANNLLQPSVVERGNYQWLFEMLRVPKISIMLKSSANAVSLATFATANKSQPLMKKAQGHYARALTSTNEALSDPAKVYDDSTLVSVILLGVYEMFVFEKHSLTAWMQHLKGAGTLFALRGENQFKSRLARQIFMQFYKTSVAKGVELGTPVPDNMAKLYRSLTSMQDYTMHGVERQVEVLEKAISLMANEEGDPVTLVSDILGLDCELGLVKFLLRTLWRYETVYLDKPAEHVFGHYYHIYTNAWVINLWTVLRICRIRLYKFVRAQVNKGLQCSPPLFSDEDAQKHLNTCKQVISSQMLDICASTPQLTGQIAFPHQVKRDVDFLKAGVETLNLRNKMFTIHPQGTFLEPFQSTGLDHLIGPLYELGRSDYGPRLTQWAIDQLYFIASRIGTRQAIYLAEELEQKLKDESNFRDWHDPCPTSAQLAAGFPLMSSTRRM
ncbi:hypothetical protein BU23DRAFT_180604 [Bimuria novae-zelandiae CBS 107.79]|uniref:Zn(2)-C6 fungal-type domain-containing protein n=1 Tax=Bimuria novae-zelandiae CBS 107.79 TaxID=1447943 RepID=A0A6A5VDS4_9PLEO|nr:hypothetical protein BU23DRAFT_180604 [Bimuria novae-zelandiae CBS 107.79]